MKGINVILPVVNWGTALGLLDAINSSTLLPGRVLLINNKEDANGLVKRIQINAALRFKLTVMTPNKNIGTNAAWNIGMKYLTEDDSHLAVLNDDIMIKPDFFERVSMAFDYNRDAGAICPHTVFNMHKFEQFDCFLPEYHPMKKREGWAFTLRSRIARNIPLIPSSLFVFCGDDWLWWWTYNYFRKKWVRDIHMCVYHAVGASMVKLPHIRRLLKAEKELYQKEIEGVKRCGLYTYMRENARSTWNIMKEKGYTYSLQNSIRDAFTMKL